MVEDMIKVYRLDQGPIELPRSKIVWTDRSRIAEICHRKRYLGYNYRGTGYVTNSRNEDLLIGASVHEGIDLLFQGGSLEKALTVTAKCYLDGKPWGHWLLPEQTEALTQDGLHLSQALVYAFHTCYLPQYLEQYEVVEVEEEINWLVKEIGDLYLVCMSRPDAILRDKSTGRLWHVSHKTTKRFDDITLQGLDVDIQRFAEGLAIKAKYGDDIEGTLYNYFIKGDRRRDEITGTDRYTTGLIRPYIQRMSADGKITPEMLAFQWEWNRLDTSTGQTSKKRLGKGWEKCSIYKEMDYLTYLEWLRAGWVDPGGDPILDSVAGMVPVYYDKDHAWRWMMGIGLSEEKWDSVIDFVGPSVVLDSPFAVAELPLASSQCFSYNHRCQWFEVCWRGKTPETLLEEGSVIPREPNHLQEFYEVM